MRLVIVAGSMLSIVGCFFSMSGPSFATAQHNAAAEFNCPVENVKQLRGTSYTGGAVYVAEACGTQVTYECMGTICQKACSYTPAEASYDGAGETDGSYRALVARRAATEFDCAPEQIKQMRHSDSSGGGLYMMYVCGKEVKYNCSGTVCNLACN